MGFEKTASWKKLKQREQEEKDKKPAGEGGQLVEITDYDVEIQSIGIVEIFHYTFNYIGILTGKQAYFFSNYQLNYKKRLSDKISIVYRGSWCKFLLNA